MSDPKRVVILNWTLRIGGVERKIADLARYLMESGNPEGHKFALLLMERPPHSKAERVFFDQVSSSEVEIHYLPQARVGRFSLDFPPSIFVLWKFLTLRPDVCLGFLRRLGMLAVVLKGLLFWRDVRVVIGEDTYSSKSLADEIPHKSYAGLVGTLMKWLFPLADLVLSPSEAAKKDLTDTFKVPGGKIVVLKNWISDLPDLYQEANRDYDVVFTGRLEPVKDVPFLLEALALTVCFHPGLRVCVVGDGSEMGKLQRLAERLDLLEQVDFVGFQDSVEEFLVRGKILCITSLYEGLPMAGLEAMAHGLPIVTRSFAGAEEFVVDGETGFVCDDIRDFDRRVRQLLDDCALRDKLGAAGRQMVALNHSKQNIATLLELLVSAQASSSPLVN